MADKQMGHASSSCAAGGGCWLACRKCGGVVGAGDGKGSGCVVMAVVTGLVGTHGVGGWPKSNRWQWVAVMQSGHFKYLLP